MENTAGLLVLFGRGLHTTLSPSKKVVVTLPTSKEVVDTLPFTTANSPPYPSAIYSETRPEYIYNVPDRHKPAGE